MKNKITEKSYVLVEKPLDENYRVKILQRYLDVVVKYGKISMSVNDDDTASLSFTYEIVECPQFWEQSKLEQSKDFTDFIGDILTHIIQTALDTGKYKIGSDDSKQAKPDNVHTTSNDDSAEAGQ